MPEENKPKNRKPLLSKKLKTELLKRYNTEVEKIGFIYPNKLVDAFNISTTPSDSFAFISEDIMEHLIKGKALGTFHTHPKEWANLSIWDHAAFLNYPDHIHVVVGKEDDIRVYGVREGIVVDLRD